LTIVPVQPQTCTVTPFYSTSVQRSQCDGTTAFTPSRMASPVLISRPIEGRRLSWITVLVLPGDRHMEENQTELETENK